MRKNANAVYHKTEVLSNTKIKVTSNPEIKVTINIPDNVRNRQEKINRIYDILKPVEQTKTA